LHSAFFLKFLNPPNNSNPSPVASRGSFKYHWVTKIDEDGSWVLGSSADKEVGISISASPTLLLDFPIVYFLDSQLMANRLKVPVGNIKAFVGNQNKEETAFEKLLLAFYNRPFQITDLAELICMTKLADYYCSLPVLSSALCTAILRSDGLCHKICTVPTEFLSIANKLRNDVLFKEALILSLGPFHRPQYLLLSDVELKVIAENAYNCLSSQVLKAQSLIVGFSVFYSGLAQTCQNFTKMSLLSGQKKPCWPQYFRNLESSPSVPLQIQGGLSSENERSEFNVALGALMKNQLQFDKSGAQSGRPGRFKEYFLCSEIGDEVLPWDPEEVDW
jgi:hypothetical protein